MSASRVPMTDLEMTKLCAEALNIGVHNSRTPFPVMEWSIYHVNGTCSIYDPLHDDAQAMELLKKFKLSLLFAGGEDWQAGHLYPEDGSYKSTFGIGANRAIVECVANMQAARI